MNTFILGALTVIPAAGWGFGAWLRNGICNLAPYWC